MHNFILWGFFIAFIGATPSVLSAPICKLWSYNQSNTIKEKERSSSLDFQTKLNNWTTEERVSFYESLPVSGLKTDEGIQILVLSPGRVSVNSKYKFFSGEIDNEFLAPNQIYGTTAYLKMDSKTLPRFVKSQQYFPEFPKGIPLILLANLISLKSLGIEPYKAYTLETLVANKRSAVEVLLLEKLREPHLSLDKINLTPESLNRHFWLTQLGRYRKLSFSFLGLQPSSTQFVVYAKSPETLYIESPRKWVSNLRIKAEWIPEDLKDSRKSYPLYLPYFDLSAAFVPIRRDEN